MMTVSASGYRDAHQVCEKSEYFEKPDNDNKDDYHVDNFFNLDIHGDVCIDKPEKNPCSDQCNQDSEEWHDKMVLGERQRYPPLFPQVLQNFIN